MAFFHADSDGGRKHLENVNIIAKDLGMQVVLPLPVKSEPTDADFEAMVKSMATANPDMVLNHGSPGPYQKLIEKAKAAGIKTSFMGVNSGSSQMVKNLGPLAQGMVFAQVVPSPWERKREIAREYQDAMRKVDPNPEFSYGGLEGYMTAKALAIASEGRRPRPDARQLRSHAGELGDGAGWRASALYACRTRGLELRRFVAGEPGRDASSTEDDSHATRRRTDLADRAQLRQRNPAPREGTP